jgi:hypothetical protein
MKKKSSKVHWLLDAEALACFASGIFTCLEAMSNGSMFPKKPHNC